jgi:hypothetical protein
MMKHVNAFALNCILLLCLNNSTQAQHDADKPAIHGMMIFGTEKIYASHLPMFHAPHHYQVILEIIVTDKVKSAFIEDQRLHPEYTTYTIAPERFVLPEMLENPRRFKSIIYRGHFERGGVPISDSIEVDIKHIIYSKRIDHQKPSKESKYILFGNDAEQFVVHALSAPPDFDQIIYVRCKSYQNPTEIIMDKNRNATVGVSGNMISASSKDGDVSLEFLKQLYLEFDDLKTSGHH